VWQMCCLYERGECPTALFVWRTRDAHPQRAHSAVAAKRKMTGGNMTVKQIVAAAAVAAVLVVVAAAAAAAVAV
jgi:hypothetical protein